MSSVHVLNTEYEEIKDEAIRLHSVRTGRANTLARWEMVLRMWGEGKSVVEIGQWYGAAESTVRRLLKRGALERQKQPGFVWPMDEQGRKICDVPHPFPVTREVDDNGFEVMASWEDPSAWAHPKSEWFVRAKFLDKAMGRVDRYCRVCHSYFRSAGPRARS